MEPTYQTEFRGQWILVIKTQKANQVKEYISKNLAKIYHQKKVQHSSIITQQREQTSRSYKLALVENITSKVGTYAEVLTRRFSPKNRPGKELDYVPNEQNIHYGEGTEGTKERARGAYVTPVKRPDKMPHQGSKGTNSHTDMDGTKPDKNKDTNEDHNNIPMDTTMDDSTHNTDGDMENSQLSFDQDFSNDSTSTTQKWVDRLMAIEQKVTTQQTEMNQRNSNWLESLEDKLEEKIERILESKMLDMSMAVADIVTRRLSKAMGKIVKGDSKTSLLTEHHQQETVVMQESRVSVKKHSTNTGDTQSSPSAKTSGNLTSTQQMVQALNNIEQQTKYSDPTHDTTTKGSVVLSS